MPLGGGFKNLKAVELNQLCNLSECIIKDSQSEITNSGYFTINGDKAVDINTQIDNFINYGNLDVSNNNNETFRFSTDNNKTYGHITHLINYGTIKASFWISNNSGGISTLTNYGYIGGGIHQGIPHTMTLNNLGAIGGQYRNANLGTAENGKILIQNYMLKINEIAMKFNGFANNGNSDKISHLVISGNGVTFKDANSKIILDLGNAFEFGAKYLINKIATDTSGATYSALGVDFDRLTPKNDIYTLYKQGEYFIARLQPQHSAISNISKANIRTMNNFWTLSNSMIYPRKHNLVILRERSDRRILKSNVIDSSPKAQNDNIVLDSAIPLKSYESFSYRNEAVNRRIQRQNKRNYSRESLKSQNLNTDSVNRTRESQNLAQNPHDYYFILTPFFNYNSFAESGNYNLSGFDYGFLTAFSARVAESNSLGAHFMMSYGTLGDKQDKDFMIKTLNLNFGLNYKLDLVWDMFIKARGDFYYFLNQAKTLTMFEAIKPNNLGFGVSVSYGKEWDFNQDGILGIEAGLDYKALQSSTISLHDNVYQKALYHLLYADLGVNYAKYFGNFGVNTGLGIKGNITANKLAKSQIRISALDRNVDMVLDNDNFLGYANLGASYVLNAKSFDMEFSLAYYGNYGDRIISNAGGFEWRVFW